MRRRESSVAADICKFCFISERHTPVHLSRRARSLARSLPLRALKSRFLRPRHLHLLPSPPGIVPPSTESSSSEVPSSDDSSAPEHGVGALRDIREGFVVGGGLYTLRTRGRPLRTRGVGERTNGHASCDRARGQLSRGACGVCG